MLLVVLKVASAESMCSPMDGKMKASYEKVYETHFMGCTLSAGERMTALSRLHWLTPAGSPPLVEMETPAMSEMNGMSKTKGGSMMMAGMKVAGSSVGRPGYLTVSTACVADLPPDFIYSLLAKSTSPKQFNAYLAAACEKYTVRNVEATTRSVVLDPQAVALAIVCIIGSLLGLFFPAFDASLIASLKAIVEDVFATLPAPSATARTIETIASA